MSSKNLVDGTLALACGDLLGALVDRVIVAVGKRARIIAKLNLGDEATSLLDSMAGIIFQVGMISIGTELITTGFDTIAEDPAALTLYLMGLWSTSTTLKENLRTINSILLMEGDYRKHTTNKDQEDSPSTSKITPPSATQ